MANKTIHTLITKFFGNDLPDAIQMSFRKWFVGGTHQQEKEEAMRELWEQVPAEADGRTVQELDRLHHRMEAVGRPVVKRSIYQQVFRIAAILPVPGL